MAADSEHPISTLNWSFDRAHLFPHRTTFTWLRFRQIIARLFVLCTDNLHKVGRENSGFSVQYTLPPSFFFLQNYPTITSLIHAPNVKLCKHRQISFFSTNICLYGTPVAPCSQYYIIFKKYLNFFKIIAIFLKSWIRSLWTLIKGISLPVWWFPQCRPLLFSVHPHFRVHSQTTPWLFSSSLYDDGDVLKKITADQI